MMPPSRFDDKVGESTGWRRRIDEQVDRTSSGRRARRSPSSRQAMPTYARESGFPSPEAQDRLLGPPLPSSERTATSAASTHRSRLLGVSNRLRKIVAGIPKVRPSATHKARLPSGRGRTRLRSYGVFETGTDGGRTRWAIGHSDLGSSDIRVDCSPTHFTEFCTKRPRGHHSRVSRKTCKSTITGVGPGNSKDIRYGYGPS